MLFDEASSETSQVRQFSGVPRAVFEPYSARPPVDDPFQASSLTRRNLSTAAGQTDDPRYGPARHRSPLIPSEARHSAPGPCSFDCQGGVYVVAPHHPATAPCPSLVTFARLPL